MYQDAVMGWNVKFKAGGSGTGSNVAVAKVLVVQYGPPRSGRCRHPIQLFSSTPKIMLEMTLLDGNSTMKLFVHLAVMGNWV